MEKPGAISAEIAREPPMLYVTAKIEILNVRSRTCAVSPLRQLTIVRP